MVSVEKNVDSIETLLEMSKSRLNACPKYRFAVRRGNRKIPDRSLITSEKLKGADSPSTNNMAQSYTSRSRRVRTVQNSGRESDRQFSWRNPRDDERRSRHVSPPEYRIENRFSSQERENKESKWILNINAVRYRRTRLVSPTEISLLEKVPT